MDDQAKHQVTKTFIDALLLSFAESLTRKTGAAWELKVLETATPADDQVESLHLRLAAEGSLYGECFLEVSKLHVTELATKILGRPATAFADEHGEAWTTVIASATTSLSAALLPAYGEVTFKVDKVEEVTLAEMFAVPLCVSQGTEPEVPMQLYFEDRLLEALSAASAAPSSNEAGQASIDPNNLKLVMDVELNVSLRFGQCQLPLREVLDLASGSVIELDRDVDDPVELLLDGKVIARGEAVIVDGNYGLRVTEIPQPMVSHFIC
jgi:flagellar motor switch protein FliN/FliY